MQAEVVDSGRQLPSIPTVSQRMLTVYAIRRKHKRLRRIFRFLVMIKAQAEVVNDYSRKIPNVAPKDDQIVQ